MGTGTFASPAGAAHCGRALKVKKKDKVIFSPSTVIRETAVIVLTWRRHFVLENTKDHNTVLIQTSSLITVVRGQHALGVQHGWLVAAPSCTQRALNRT